MSPRNGQRGSNLAATVAGIWRVQILLFIWVISTCPQPTGLALAVAEVAY
jgi:hypothetical protein